MMGESCVIVKPIRAESAQKFVEKMRILL